MLKAFEKEASLLLHNCRVYCCDATPELSAACHSTEYTFKVPDLDHPDYIPFLISKCKEHHIRLIIPTIDTELLLLAEHRSLFEQNNITVIVSDLDLIKVANNKRDSHEFFKHRSIPVAKEFTDTPPSFPVFIKPFTGSRSRDSRTIYSVEELKYFTKGREDIMILEYLDHRDYDEITCDLYYDKAHQLKCIIPRKRLLVRAGEVNKGITIRNSLFDFIREKLGEVPGAIGCICIQFFIHKVQHNIFAIEINARFSGGFPLTYAAGGNFPKWIIQEFMLSEDIPEQFDSWEENLLMLRYDKEIMVHGSESKS